MRFPNCLLTSTLCLIALFAGAEEPVVPGAPRLLPERTLAYVRIEDVSQFRSEMAASATGRMLADPKLRAIAGETYLAASDLFEQLGQQLGVTLDELLAIPKGQLAAALFLIADDEAAVANSQAQPADQPKDDSPEAIRKRLEAKPMVNDRFAGLFVIGTGDDDATLQKILATLEAKLTESGFIARRETISGTSLTRIIRANNPKRAVEYFSRDGTTVIGIGSGAAETALRRWNGKSTDRSLAESTDFAAVMGRCIGAEETRPQITFFVDPYRIAERAIKGSGGGAAFVWPMVESLGIGKIRGIGASVFQGGEMFADISHLHVLIDPPRDGIFSVVRPGKGDTNPPVWVPDDVASYISLNWRVDKSFEGFEKIFDRFSGDGSFATRVLDPFKKATGLELRESLIETTQDRLVMITWLQRPITFNSNTSLVAVQLKDPAQTAQTIETLRQTIWKSLQTDSVGATKIYVGRRPNRVQDEDLPPTVRAPEPCGAIIGDWLMVSDSRQLLEHVIRANSGSVSRLSSQPEYDLVASELGAQLGSEEPFMFSFSRDSEALRQVYELAKSPNVKELLRSRSENNPVAKRFAELIEKNELPPFDEFSKYFAPSGSFAYDEPTGIHVGRYTLKAD